MHAGVPRCLYAGWIYVPRKELLLSAVYAEEMASVASGLCATPASASVSASSVSGPIRGRDLIGLFDNWTGTTRKSSVSAAASTAMPVSSKTDNNPSEESTSTANFEVRPAVPASQSKTPTAPKSDGEPASSGGISPSKHTPSVFAPRASSNASTGDDREWPHVVSQLDLP
ncbi:hypothetical protein BDW74DRAFT_119785 [Aspergillus multicolor]|uniref:uncharacterized protein n=1 Tax=Aspergillus multicolor TaxID=41759 RepID=UPI003CCCA939